MLPADVMLTAYANGYFPMAVEPGDIRWFSPDPRGILPLDRFHISRRLQRRLRQARFRLSVDTAFTRVIEACAEGREEGSWIDTEIIDSYRNLHRLGHAHSVEVWREDRLAGGLYGVSLRGAFFGESMFHRETDASKVALHALVERLRARQYRLLDVQWATEHLMAFGAIEVSRRQYLARLAAALEVDCSFV